MFVWSFWFRILKKTVGGFPRPLLNLSSGNFARVFDEALGYQLVPPFDPYRNNLNFMLASYLIPYVGLVAYVGTNPNINGYQTKRVNSSNLRPWISFITGKFYPTYYVLEDLLDFFLKINYHYKKFVLHNLW